jgi:hypothetical protein
MAIDINDVTNTYNGKDGCACGCGGDYATPAENMKKVKSRVNRINAALADPKRAHTVGVQMDREEAIYYIENEKTNRAVRVYVALND